MMSNREKITALIITFNEIGYIEKCLESVSFVDEIIVVDSFSTDGTYEYLLNHPKVTVIQNPFENFTAQKSFALKQATNDWVLFLDADEVVPASLKNEILDTVSKESEIAAYWFYRQFMFQNEKLRFSGWQTDKNYRLFRKSKAKFSDRRIVHETLDVEGASGILTEKLIHYCYKNYEDYKSKMLNYGRLKAIECFYRERKFNYAAMYLKTGWKFFNHYILRLGFLDGKKGFVICYLNALGVLERFRELKRLEQKNELAYYLVMP
ncbi:glycosyltransferase family 2 protein [Maribacter algicola]|uniref:Glycosyltransferase family 2 protein n=1 Tax=Maribacter algicola TaxID=2498892 RepID=A0A426RF47_9FLAO|nr:glycosyltransferase family 2 protein [Maribacter algicola]RRQ47543.1 glycosyltransferase family 2 protein [Maribacter algicola]